VTGAGLIRRAWCAPSSCRDLAVFFYQDRLEPEPVGHVARMFVIGLALAGAVGIPLTDQLFRVQEWLYRDTPSQWLGSIFIIGGVEAFLIFATVRYFIFDSPEFDERTDGVVYATAAALGYATALNLHSSSPAAARGSAAPNLRGELRAEGRSGECWDISRPAKLGRPVWWLSPAAVDRRARALSRLTASLTRARGSAGLPSFTGLSWRAALIVVTNVGFPDQPRHQPQLDGTQAVATDPPSATDVRSGRRRHFRSPDRRGRICGAAR
jgi:hypothetical protein